MTPIAELMTRAPVIPVLTVERVEDAAPLAEALAAGGLPVLEVTLRTPAALDALKAMKALGGDLVVGAGTILNADDLAKAEDAGADFIVTPGVTPTLLNALRQSDTPILPGAATVSESLTLLDAGFDRQKFFPAEASGGAAAVKSFSGPLPQITFCPTGGIKPQTAENYLSLPNVACVGGTWVAPGAAIAAGDWAAITETARHASALGKTPA